MVVEKEARGSVLHLRLNHPGRGNALNPETAGELKKALGEAGTDDKITVVCISGNGKHFCTGADLHWMRAARNLSPAENVEDMGALRDLYKALLNFEKIVVVRAHGRVMGGGVGLVSAADIAVCETGTSFCLSEASLGLIPGIITPFVMRRIGHGNFSYYALSAQEFGSAEALRIQLVSRVLEGQDGFETFLNQLAANSPAAMREIKRLALAKNPVPEAEIEELTRLSARFRQGPDFQSRVEQKFSKKT